MRALRAALKEDEKYDSCEGDGRLAGWRQLVEGAREPARAARVPGLARASLHAACCSAPRIGPASPAAPSCPLPPAGVAGQVDLWCAVALFFGYTLAVILIYALQSGYIDLLKWE